MNRFLRIILLLFAGFVAYPVQADTVDGEPSAVVRNLQQALIGVMKEAQALGYQGRYDRLKPVVLETHGLPFIARAALGRHWSDLKPEEQSAFVDAFTRLTLATYASRFDGYSGETFQVMDEQPIGASGQVLVHGQLLKSDGSKVKFDYVLRKTDGGWRIINIVYDGVSDLALKRAEYGAVIEKDGIAALIKQIEGRIASYASAH
jgi:phospholipid transport system substrate-binding protein